MQITPDLVKRSSPWDLRQMAKALLPNAAGSQEDKDFQELTRLAKVKEDLTFNDPARAALRGCCE